MELTKADLHKNFDLTKEERKAIKALQRVAKIWPDSLWLFAASGTLCIMRCEQGERVFRDSEGVDPAYKVTTIQGLFCEGGDW
jgi:hypothetical protein